MHPDCNAPSTGQSYHGTIRFRSSRNVVRFIVMNWLGRPYAVVARLMGDAAEQAVELRHSN